MAATVKAPTSNVSVVDYLSSQGKASDYNSRATLAKSYGITNYTGTAEQNIKLLNTLKGSSTPASTTPVSTPTTTTPVATKPPSNIAEANAYINGDQQTNFDTASKVDQPPTRGSSVDDLLTKVQTTLTGGMEKPATISLADTYVDLKGKYGINDLETSLTALQAQARDLQAASAARTATEKGKPVAMNVIAGRVTEEEAQDNERLTAINNSIQTVTSQLQSKYNVVDNIMKYTGQDYDNAVSAYDKQFAQNLQVFNLVRGLQEDEKTDADRVVDNARANAQIMINTMNANGTTFDALSPDQQANLTKLGVQSGLGSSFFHDVMKVSAGKEILTTITNDDKTKTSIIYKDGTSKILQTGLPAGSGVTPKSTDGKVYTSGGLKYTDTTLGNFGTALEVQKGNDGFVPPQVYLQAYKDWVNNKGLQKDFVTHFPPADYVNPAAKELPLYLQNKSKDTGRSL